MPVLTRGRSRGPLEMPQIQWAGMSGHNTVNGEAYLLPRTCLMKSKQHVIIAWELQSEASVGWRELFRGCLESAGRNESGSFH